MKCPLSHLIIKFAIFTAIAASIVALSSCDKWIYEEEGDCTPHYKARFVFDLNMKFVDAFATEVDEVSLWLLNQSGTVVWSKTEKVTLANVNDYLMDIDVAPGTYELIAWCKGVNSAPTGAKGSFSLFGGDNITQRSHLGCTIDHTPIENANAISNQDLHRIYHGKLDAFTFPDQEGVHIAEISLTKDTNVVRVMLQQMQGSEIDPENFIFNIHDDNIVMDHYNNVINGNPISYGAWSKTGAAAESKASGVNCVIAELTTGRLLDRDQTILHITRKNGSTVLKIPLVKYALMVKGMYNKEMTDQEYLDRKDEYNLTFFLNDMGIWINSVVMIESWRIVENTIE